MSVNRVPPSLAESLSEFASVFAPDQTPECAAQIIVDLAKRTLPESDGVGMTLRTGRGFETRAITDPWVGEVDEVQYAADNGPCLESIRKNRVVHGPELKSNDAWGAVGPGMAERGVLSSLSVPLGCNAEALGALNIYSRSASSYDETTEELAQCLVGPAAAVYMQVLAHSDSVALTRQLEEALTSRAAIEQAKGILIATRHCTPEEAFEMLKKASQHSNVKLREIAEQVVTAFSAGRESPIPSD